MSDRHPVAQRPVLIVIRRRRAVAALGKALLKGAGEGAATGILGDVLGGDSSDSQRCVQTTDSVSIITGPDNTYRRAVGAILKPLIKGVGEGAVGGFFDGDESSSDNQR